jgi:hypothetical protein
MHRAGYKWCDAEVQARVHIALGGDREVSHVRRGEGGMWGLSKEAHDPHCDGPPQHKKMNEWHCTYKGLWQEVVKPEHARPFVLPHGRAG